MKRILACLLLAAALGLVACRPEADAFTVRVSCESPNVHMIFYTCYVDGASRGAGGMADLDHRALTPDSELEISFPRGQFEPEDDLAGFAIDFSPYGEEDTCEAGTTNRLPIPAEMGKTYRVILSGDRETGFSARLAP